MHPHPQIVIGAAAIAVLMSACGSETNPPSTAPTPSPGPFLVVADRRAGTLVTLEANPSGALSIASSLTVSDPHYREDSPQGGGYYLAAHPRGQLVLLAGGGYNANGTVEPATIRSYAVDKATGQLSERSVALAGSSRPFFWTLAVAERHVYVGTTAGNAGSHRASARYGLDPATGVLEACVSPCGSGLPIERDISFLVPAPDGRFVYSNDGVGSVYTSALQPEGALLEIGAVDLGVYLFEASAALGPGFLAVNTDDIDPAELVTLASDPNTGLLSPRQRVQASPGRVVVSSTGLIALVAYKAPQTWSIETWSVDAAGALTLRGSVPVTGVVRGLAFDPTGRFLYASGWQEGSIVVFAVDPSGVLRTLSTYPSSGGLIVTIPR